MADVELAGPAHHFAAWLRLGPRQANLVRRRVDTPRPHGMGLALGKLPSRGGVIRGKIFFLIFFWTPSLSREMSRTVTSSGRESAA